jgi:hypothetical protein
MDKAIALATAIIAVTGLTQASPALARSRTPTPPPSRNIICEPPPPTSNVVTSKQGGIALQLPGLGVSGDRQRFASKTDVIAGVEGSLGHMALTMLAWACHTAVTKWPNNPEKQLEFLLPYLDRLQGTVAAAAAVGAELAASGRNSATLARSDSAMAPTAPATVPQGAQARLEPQLSGSPERTREVQGTQPPSLFDVTPSDLTPEVDVNGSAQTAPAAPQPAKRLARPPATPLDYSAGSGCFGNACLPPTNNGCFGNACQGWGNGLDPQMNQTRSYAATVPTVSTTMGSSMTSSSSCVPVMTSTIAIRVGNGITLLGPPPMPPSTVLEC